jgi:thiol:disulfide interchange protein
MTRGDRCRFLVAALGLSALPFGLFGWKVGRAAYNEAELRRVRGRHVYESGGGPATVQAALARARAENKRVLIVLGGDFCEWCLELDDLFVSDPDVRAFLDAHYVVRKLDADAYDAMDERLGRPTRNGVPVLVFLSADGSVLHVEPTAPLETLGGRVLAYDRGRVLAVLRRFVA